MSNPWADLDRPPLRERELRRVLTEGPDPSWRRIDVVEQTGSTNADVAGRARTGEGAGLVLVAESQVSGRGRRGRSWEAPARSALTFSVLLRPSAPRQHWAWLGLLAGVAVADALRDDCGLGARLKWPNDVLVPPAPRALDGSGAPYAAGPMLKVAGLLSEVVVTPSGAAVVLGIGLNVSQDLDELPVGTATSMVLAGSARTDRGPVLRSVLRHLATRYAAWDAAAGDPRTIAPDYRERCDTIGREVRVLLPPDGTSSADGVAEGVDDEGRLLLRQSSGPDGPDGTDGTDGSDGPDGPDGTDAKGGQQSGTIRALSVGDVVHVRPAGGRR